MRIWDAAAPFYETFMSANRRGNEQLVTFYRTFLAPDMKVLEIGCGPGTVTKHIAGSCRELVATDFSNKMVEQARKRVAAENTEFLTASAYSLPFPDASFDAVVASNMLHVVSDPEAVLAEAARVLRPGGALLLSTFVLGSKRAKAIEPVLKIVGGGKELWNLSQLAQMFRGLGWQVHSARTISSAFPLACVAATKGRRVDE
ncbi:MAG: class I SAM-dependent methyltransferase [Actinomycetaceae bacterium]|nr:class I SAM-dependent methyltransferase [Actinomycetaceae bacterium]